jgi:hypothetical protein
MYYHLGFPTKFTSIRHEAAQLTLIKRNTFPEFLHFQSKFFIFLFPPPPLLPTPTPATPDSPLFQVAEETQ